MGLHRVLDYAVYALVSPELRPRWLAMISGSPDEQALGITFAHGWLEDRGDRWIDVTTALRTDAPDGWLQAEWDVYDHGLTVLTRTETDIDTAEGKKWRTAAEAFNADHRAHLRLWEDLNWTVDDAPVSARSFSIDAGWTALCVELTGGLLCVNGRVCHRATLSSGPLTAPTTAST